MTIEEYFGDWLKVLDKQETMKIMGWLKTVNPNSLCPSIRNVFKAFELCKYKECNDYDEIETYKDDYTIELDIDIYDQ